jgi:hypothetical protein
MSMRPSLFLCCAAAFTALTLAGCSDYTGGKCKCGDDTGNMYIYDWGGCDENCADLQDACSSFCTEAFQNGTFLGFEDCTTFTVLSDACPAGRAPKPPALKPIPDPNVPRQRR